MTFLFVLSILVNMTAILAIITLSLRQNRLLDFEKQYIKFRQETEEIIQTFIIEMKEENEEIKQFLRDDSNSSDEVHNQNETKPRIDQPIPERPQGYYQKSAMNAYANINTEPDENVKLDETLISTEKSLKRDQDRMLNEIQEMEKQGKTVEEIAKRMGRGKTEIELLLKLN